MVRNVLRKHDSGDLIGKSAVAQVLQDGAAYLVGEIDGRDVGDGGGLDVEDISPRDLPKVAVGVTQAKGLGSVVVDDQ